MCLSIGKYPVFWSTSFYNRVCVWIRYPRIGPSSQVLVSKFRPHFSVRYSYIVLDIWKWLNLKKIIFLVFQCKMANCQPQTLGKINPDQATFLSLVRPNYVDTYKEFSVWSITKSVATVFPGHRWSYRV